MTFWLYPYKAGTAGGKELITALKGKRIKLGSRKKPWKWNKNKVVINWGSRSLEGLSQEAQNRALNPPGAVIRAVDKLRFFSGLRGTPTQEYVPHSTETKAQAQTWIDSGYTVVARTILNGHSGAGIIICAPKGKNELPEAPLYTKYIPKDQEFRIHILKAPNGVFDNFYNQRKVKREDFEGKHNRFVRCFDNGYTYQHNDIDIPPTVISTAITVFSQTGLDFGAVDVIYVKKDNKAYVLEINTAPGLTGLSVERYAEVFKKYFIK